MIGHQWQPIKPIDAASEGYDFTEIDALQRQWRNILELRGDAAFRPYLERLERSWAIETGIIEGLYTLDRGVTETLIQRGIVAEYIERSSTNKEPQDLVAVLNDHQEAIASVSSYIRAGNPLTVSFIRQLHQVITRHQDTYAAVDQFGTLFEARLDKGKFKEQPNNPKRPDGRLHQYCPPEQVDSEVDNLLRFYNEMQQKSCHPILTGAWLHHAFTQIHPFQDGNGRVVRALLTWHLVKENYLPIVIYRDGYEEYSQSRSSREEYTQSLSSREKYIQALELADGGDLNPFIDLIVQSEKRTILQALGEPEPAAQPGVVSQVVDHIVEQLQKRNQDQAAQLRSVNEVAGHFRGIAENYLTSAGDSISHRLNEVGMSLSPFLDTGGPGDREHWYREEVVTTANNAKSWVNLNEARFFVKLSLQNDLRDAAARPPRLVFVISLHHTGRELSGIMEATAFALIEHYPEAAEGQSEGTSYFKDCTVEHFTFTGEVDAIAATDRFIDWIEHSFGVALNYWRGFLT